MKTESKTVKYHGVELVLFYTVDGKFTPATRTNPAEYPEVEILRVMAGDWNIMPILLECQMDDIYELLDNCYYESRI